jgi:hypothetical protein
MKVKTFHIRKEVVHGVVGEVVIRIIRRATMVQYGTVFL